MAELRAKICPESLKYLIAWLSELRSPVTYVELESWARLTCKRLRAWESEALVRLDFIRSPSNW